MSEELQKQSDHWKANHDAQVEIKRKLSKMVGELKAEIAQHIEINRRAMAIISDAVMHGMPITKEVAEVRNRIVSATKTGVIGNVSETEKVNAALLIGFAAGLCNLKNAKEWDNGTQLELAACVDMAKEMIWGEPRELDRIELDRLRISGLQDDLMIGLVTGEDVYEAMIKEKTDET